MADGDIAGAGPKALQDINFKDRSASPVSIPAE
jgi:hypothetical protein